MSPSERVALGIDGAAHVVGVFFSVIMHAVNLIVANLGHHHSTLFKLREPLHLFHQVGQLRILIDLYSISDYRCDHIGT